MFLPGPHGSPVASQIAQFHNRLRHAVLESGALVFSASALGVEPMPADDAPLVDPDRIVFAMRDHDVTEAEVKDWLAEYSREQTEAREQRDRLRAREALEAAARRDGREAQRGHRTGPANCESCGAYKPRPSTVCGQCEG